MLLFVQQFFHDLALLFGYIWHQTLMTFRWFVNSIMTIVDLIRGFFSSAFSPPVENEMISFPPEVFDILEQIPAFSLLTTSIGVGIIALFVFVVIKTFQKL